MSLVRRLSTRSLIAFAVLAVLLVSGGAAIARSALSTGSPPPAAALDQAILDASQGATPAGITARIHFTNNLIASGSLPTGMTTPLLSGASGRLWVQGDGKFRLELQGSNGDTEISSDGTRLSLLDVATNTVYRLPASKASGTPAPKAGHAPLTLATIDDALAKLGAGLTIGGANPTTVAGQGAYETTVSPKQNGGLIGGLGLAFDAANGVPLRVSLTAAGSSSPVLQLEVTDISFGAVADSDVTVTPPAGAKIVEIAAPGNPDPSSGSGPGSHGTPIEVLPAVRAAAGFTVTAPDTLVGLQQASVRLIDWNGTKVAVAAYGKGLGSIVVAELPAGAKDPLASFSQLPSISINGTTGRELATALGTAVTFQKDGVRTVVFGSVPTVSAEQAARELVS